MKWLLLACFHLFLVNAVAQPHFKGGERALNQLIVNNLIYPEYSKQNCLQGTIEVSFKVDKQGRVFESKVQDGPGIDLDKEALRIVRLTSGKWVVPAEHDTATPLIIPINFSLAEYHCEQKSRDDIKAAIAAYKAREDLTRAITNFYQNKSQGRYKADEEEQIENLKQQLGYDDKYVGRLLRQAKQKLKQGDHDGACEDFNFIRKIGSDKADSYIKENCQ